MQGDGLGQGGRKSGEVKSMEKMEDVEKGKEVVGASGRVGTGEGERGKMGEKKEEDEMGGSAGK